MRTARTLLTALLLVVAAVGGSAAASAGPVGPPPALQPDGATPDGWEAFVLADGALPDALPPGSGFRGEIAFRSGADTRLVRIVVPPAVRRPAPVLVALHGLYETVEAADRAQGWGPVVRAAGGVLVQGIGVDGSWNAGLCCGPAQQRGVDDVLYLDRVLALAEALTPLDPKRTGVTGFSNGAMMAYRYACQRRQRVAGVVAVAGTVVHRCSGRSDVAVLHVHGTADRTVPLAGLDYSRTLRSPLRPVAQTARVFGPTITARVLPQVGHTWPTRARGGYATSQQGWAWLMAHPKR